MLYTIQNSQILKATLFLSFSFLPQWACSLPQTQVAIFMQTSRILYRSLAFLRIQTVYKLAYWTEILTEKSSENFLRAGVVVVLEILCMALG